MPQEHERGAERGWERGRPTQLLESREHVHHEEAVVRLALHHWVQPQVHVRERCQGVEPEDLRQRGDAVVVKVEALQCRQALNALLGQTQGETGVNRHTPHTHTPHHRRAEQRCAPPQALLQGREVAEWVNPSLQGLTRQLSNTSTITLPHPALSAELPLPPFHRWED